MRLHRCATSSAKCVHADCPPLLVFPCLPLLAAGDIISNVNFTHFSVCQSMGSCVVLEGPGTLQDVSARGNFMVHGTDPEGWWNHPAFAALRVRGSSAPILNNTQVIFQVRGCACMVRKTQ